MRDVTVPILKLHLVKYQFLLTRPVRDVTLVPFSYPIIVSFLLTRPVRDVT